MSSNISSPWDPRLSALHQELRSVKVIAEQAALKIHQLEEDISRLQTAARPAGSLSRGYDPSNAR